MSRFKLEAGSPTLINGNDILILGPVAMDLKSRDPFRFTGTVVSGKATFRLLGSLTETTYPGGGDWSEIRRFSASDLEGVAFVNQEYPYVVVLASQTVEGEDANVSAHIGHLVGGDVGDFDPLAIAGDYIPGKRVENTLFNNPDIRFDPEDVWEIGGTRTIPSTPAQLDIVSNSAQDDVAGTGAQVALIEGVVDNSGTWELGLEQVLLSGGATVQTTQVFVFVHRCVILCGSNGTNHDDIEIFHGGDLQLRINPDFTNISHASHFLVPDNTRAFISALHLSSSSGKNMSAEVMIRLPGTTSFLASHPIYLFDSPYHESDLTITPFEARAYIKVAARNLTGGRGRISGRMTLILEDQP